MSKKKRTASQVGKMSRRKGKVFERECARHFTKWTGLKWETTRNSGRTDLKGDIYCVSRPDLDLVVECKYNKIYTVHAMLLTAKTFVDMILEVTNKANHPVLFIIKNETGIWVSWCTDVQVFKKCPNVKIKFMSNTMIIGGMDWHKIDDIEYFEIDGINFDGSRLGRVSKEG